MSSETNIIAAIGIDDGSTNFEEVFTEMGIPKQWILTPKNTPSEIRQAFALASQSAVRASQGAASFSQTAMGGFGTP
jgi:activator of 2-hydroxyglutaryl-CoA dehydratase